RARTYHRNRAARRLVRARTISPLPPEFLLQGLDERLRERLIGAVEPERRHRDVALPECREVGAFRRGIHHRGALEADPEIGIAAAIAPLVDPQKAEIALGLPRGADSGNLLRRAGRGVYIDSGVLGDARGDHLAQDLGPEFPSGLPRRPVARLDAEFLRQRE